MQSEERNGTPARRSKSEGPPVVANGRAYPLAADTDANGPDTKQVRFAALNSPRINEFSSNVRKETSSIFIEKAKFMEIFYFLWQKKRKQLSLSLRVNNKSQMTRYVWSFDNHLLIWHIMISFYSPLIDWGYYREGYRYSFATIFLSSESIN